MVFAQETTSQLYERLESLYIEVIEVYLGGGDLCLGRSQAVEQKQTELATHYRGLLRQQGTEFFYSL